MKPRIFLLSCMAAALLLVACTSPSPATDETVLSSTPTGLSPAATPTARSVVREEVEGSAEIPTSTPEETGGEQQEEGPLAPDFELASASGEFVSLEGLLEGRDAAIIVFYRGFF